MEKINFENLPSTNEPLNATNLNKMQQNIEKSAVIISPTEPTTNEKVWLKKGKNLIKSFIKGYLNTNGVLSKDDYCATTDFIEIEPNVDYIFSNSMGTPAGGIYLFDKDKVFLERLSQDNNLAVINTSNSNAKYITIVVWSQNINDLQWMQLEQNNVVTANEEYIEPTIYVKNNNGIFEEFIKKDNLDNYSFGEQKIGTWIDGKPLYRKTIQIDSLPNNEAVTYNHNIENVDRIWIDGSDSFLISENVEDTSPINNVWALSNELCGIFVSRTFCCINTNVNYSRRSAIITLKYTKTTD